MEQVKEGSAQAGRPITCRGKYCWGCCSEPVYASWGEVDNALSRMPPDLRKRVKVRTQEWMAKVVPSGLLKEAEPNVIAWRGLRAPCPFLEAGSCTIYNDRPLSCREHVAVGDPMNCFDDELRKHQEYCKCNEFTERIAYRMLDEGMEMKMDNLGVWLCELLLGETIASTARREYSQGGS